MTRDDIIKRMGWTAAAERGMPDVLDRIERIVRAAEAAEREECAKVADYYDDVIIAQAIRARGNP